MQVFVTVGNAGMKINANLNAKNWLIKVYAIKDLFGILVIASVNAINLVILVNRKKCWKRLVDKLVEECTENIGEMIDNENKHENKCNSCTVYIVLFFIPFA